ncbi:MAG: hypothetical protein ACYSTG_10600, partial [Planctomycetota bacterium]
GMVMKTYWWKITAAAAVLLAAVITAKVFWPGKATRISPSRDIGPQSRTQETANQCVTACPTGALAFTEQALQSH